MAPRRLWGWVRRAAYDSEVALCPRIPLADCPGCASLSGLIKVSSLLPLWRGRPGWEEILVLILSPPPVRRPRNAHGKVLKLERVRLVGDTAKRCRLAGCSPRGEVGKNYTLKGLE